MKYHPLICTAEEVRAILDGSKTQLRKIAKPQPPCGCHYELNGVGDKWLCLADEDQGLPRPWFVPVRGDSADTFMTCHYRVGDRFYAKETWYDDQLRKTSDIVAPDNDIYYRADGECCEQIPECACAEVGQPQWRSSVHLPRKLSRIELEITNIRGEWLNDISEADAEAEGMWRMATEDGRFGWGAGPPAPKGYSYRSAFKFLWDIKHEEASRGWDKNDFVFPIDFKVVK